MSELSITDDDVAKLADGETVEVDGTTISKVGPAEELRQIIDEESGERADEIIEDIHSSMPFGEENEWHRVSIEDGWRLHSGVMEALRSEGWEVRSVNCDGAYFSRDE